jgi:hypothetical protein
MDSTQRFFWQEVPAMIARQPQAFAMLFGSIAFSCAGHKATLRLGNVTQPIVAGFDRRASLRVWFFGDAFSRFLAGQHMDGKHDHMHQGDTTVLSRFGLFLSAGHSALSVRFQSFP